MADLILNGSNPYGDEFPTGEKYYEFDSEDKTVVKQLKILLALRKHGDKDAIEKQIAALCARSMEKKRTADAGKKTLSHFLRNIFSVPKQSTHARCAAVMH